MASNCHVGIMTESNPECGHTKTTHQVHGVNKVFEDL